MPELPEVETIRHDLQILLDQKLTNFDILDQKLISSQNLKTLKNHKLTAITRRGKYLIFEFSDLPSRILAAKNGLRLTFHLRMTGRLILDSQKSKHSRLFLQFNHNALLFDDIRKFGTLEILTAAQLDTKLKTKLGPEATSISADHLAQKAQKSTTPVKTFLLKQEIIAGLGNIYVDEILFASRTNPLTPTKNIKNWSKIAKNTKKIIKTAIQHRGTTFRDYRDAKNQTGNFAQKLKVYGRAGKPCKNCHKTLQKIKISGRGTVFCPHCQKI